MYVLMYKLGLRISEISDYSKLYNHAIQFHNCSINKGDKTLKLKMETGKHKSEPSYYNIRCSNKLFYHLKQFLKKRGDRTGPLFVHENGRPFSRKFIVQLLKNDINAIGEDGNSFNTHSFRTGLATDLALKGCSSTQIGIIE